MAVFHTAGAPPSSGNAMRANSGWMENTRNAPSSMVPANHASVASPRRIVGYGARSH